MINQVHHNNLSEGPAITISSLHYGWWLWATDPRPNPPRASWPVFPRLSNYSWRLLWDNLNLRLRPGNPRVRRQSPGPGANSHYFRYQDPRPKGKPSTQATDLLQQRHSGSRPGSPNLLLPPGLDWTANFLQLLAGSIK